MLRGKLLSLLVPYGLLTGVAAADRLVLLRFTAAWGAYAWLCLLLIGYGMFSISTTLGFACPRLDWDDPRRMTSSKASWASFLINVPYGLISMALAAAAFVLGQFWPQYTLPLVLLAVLLLALLSWVTARLGARRVAKAWPRLEAP